jgi:hypothetical protein
MKSNIAGSGPVKPVSATLYLTDGRSVPCEPDERHGLKPNDFTLEDLYTLLECSTIQVIYLYEDEIMIIDEEGKLVHKPINVEATKIFQRQTGNYADFIVGNAIVCPRRMLK